MVDLALQVRVLETLRESEPDAFGSLVFTMLDVGALPLEGEEGPFHQLTEIFPESRVIGFEVGEALCDELRNKAERGHEFYPVPLGRAEESRQFFHTADPMCSSLYRPNEELLAQYFNMESAIVEEITTVDTVSLDHFVVQHGVAQVDFIKIDIQGAELDVFMGGTNTLRGTTVIVSEVEFIPHYIDQPLFGDVSRFLGEQGFMFHKFLGMAGRALRPVVVNNDRNSASQHIWSDAMFIKNILRLSEQPVDQLLKMGVLSYLYNSPDVAFSCFRAADEKGETDIGLKFLQAGRNASVQAPARRSWTNLFRR